MRIATWNVNSVVARRERLLAWLQRHEPDVLCLQELKGIAEKFPGAEVEALGYRAALFGQKSYNGVAILAREALGDVRLGLDSQLEGGDARLVAATVAGVRVICVYVPNGGELDSDKYAYKLRWLARLRGYLDGACRPDEPLVLCGDFNCAPDARDVAKPELWGEGVLTHPDVRAALTKLEAWGLADTFRRLQPAGGFYSWWDYRGLGFPMNNGLRIDMVFASAPLVERLNHAWIDRDERKGKKPSDHAPVVADFAWP